MSIAEFALGRPTEAAKLVDQALNRAEELRHKYSSAQALYFACVFYQLSRNLEYVQRHLKKLEDECGTAHFGVYAAGAAVLRRWAQVEQGETGAKIEQVDQDLNHYRAEETKFLLPYWLAVAAEALCKCGKPKEALSKLDEALNLTNETTECWFEPELHRRRGELLLRPPDAEQAKAMACFHRAIGVARSQEAKLWELRAATSLARLWRDQGKKAEAHDLLAPVYGRFKEGLDTADLKYAKALLKELC
jgi:predicted ATPase